MTLVGTITAGVTAGGAVVGTMVCWGDGADCVHPAERRSAKRSTRIPVAKNFMICPIHASRVMHCGKKTIAEMKNGPYLPGCCLPACPIPFYPLLTYKITDRAGYPAERF